MRVGLFCLLIASAGLPHGASAADLPWRIDMDIAIVKPLANAAGELDPTAIQIRTRPVGLFVVDMTTTYDLRREGPDTWLSRWPIRDTCQIHTMANRSAHVITIGSCNQRLWPQIGLSDRLRVDAYVSMNNRSQTRAARAAIKILPKHRHEVCDNLPPRAVSTVKLGSAVEVFWRRDPKSPGRLHVDDLCVRMTAIGAPQTDFQGVVTFFAGGSGLGAAVFHLKCKPTKDGEALPAGTSLSYEGKSCITARSELVLPPGSSIKARVSAEFGLGGETRLSVLKNAAVPRRP